MSSRYKVIDNAVPHFVTFTAVGWIDVFSRQCYKDTICESLNYCIQEKGLLLHAWVIMSNHLHLIISTTADQTISDFVRDFKKFTSRKIIAQIKDNDRESRREWMINLFAFSGSQNNSNKEYQFWQQEYHPVILDSSEKVIQRLTYLHENPVRAGIVWQAEQYKYSSSVDYLQDQPGILNIAKLVL